MEDFDYPTSCVFIRFLDELNSPFREGAFNLTGNGISVKDAHNLAVPDTIRGTLLTENTRALRRRPNKRQFGDKRQWISMGTLILPGRPKSSRAHCGDGKDREWLNMWSGDGLLDSITPTLSHVDVHTFTASELPKGINGWRGDGDWKLLTQYLPLINCVRSM